MIQLLKKVRRFLRKQPTIYQVAVFRKGCDPATDDPLREMTGSGSLPGGILIDGFNRMVEIELDRQWDKMRREGLSQHQFNAKTFETFVKFGAAVQEIREFQVVLRLD